MTLTNLVAFLGVLAVVGFCVVWWPGSLLVAGVVLLWLAAVRRVNERAVSSGRSGPAAR